MTEELNMMLDSLSWGWALIAIAMIFIGFPLLRQRHSVEPGINPELADISVNAELYQQQLIALEQQLAVGEIDQQQFDELIAEQQKLLLADASAESLTRQPELMKGGWMLLAALLILPLLALKLYSVLGASTDVAITALLEQQAVEPDPDVRVAIRAELIGKMGGRLQQLPDHVGYQVTQARLLTEAGQFEEAVNHYRRAIDILPDDVILMAEYTQTAYLAEGNRFTPDIEVVMDKVLKADPGNVTVLGLQGIRAFSRQDYRQALLSWQLALSGVATGSAQAAALQSGISRAREQLGEPLPGVSVRVQLAVGLEASPEQTVFVYAVEAGASPMPLAISRLTVADLPMNLRLDDSMAMPGGKPLSSADKIQLIARVSASGNAAPAPGDLEGRSNPLSLGEAGKGVELVIDTLIR